MVSCSGFGLPMHAQLLRLFVTLRDELCRHVQAATLWGLCGASLVSCVLVSVVL